PWWCEHRCQIPMFYRQGASFAANSSRNSLPAQEVLRAGSELRPSDYVVRCKNNEVARRVKLADLEDNSRLDRTILRPQRFEADVARLRKYVLSYKFLTDQITEDQYRTLMGKDR